METSYFFATVPICGNTFTINGSTTGFIRNATYVAIN